MSDLKAGDRALIAPWARNRPGETGVIAGCGQRHSGMTCVLLTSPEKPYDRRNWRGHEIICKIRAECNCEAWVETKWLIRLPPDSEMATLVRQSEVSA